MIPRLCALVLVALSLNCCALVLVGTALNAAGATHEHNTGFDRERPPSVDQAAWVPVHN